jgi:peptidoglycan L-alanyl-D-glutamate endopeptidase CwlK
MRQLTKAEVARYNTLHTDLKRLIDALRAKRDVFIVYGHRTQAEQDKAFKGGFSKVQWPNSKHNKTPSLAVDLAPVNAKGGIDWNDLKGFKALYADVMATALDLGIKLRAGADFNQDGNLANDRFVDLPHYELI